MDEDEAARLFTLADLIHAIGRQLRPPADLAPGMCTPVEISVMRFVNDHPGTSARAASEATLLPSSNFSRVVTSLEAKGLVRREIDPGDTRRVRLYPTPLAGENRASLRAAWSGLLDGIVEDPDAVDAVNRTLRRIEAGLVARRRSRGDA